MSLKDKVLGMVFEKPSLRTRSSFEAAMAQMGGNSIFLSATDGPIGQRESVPDFARTLCEYVDAVVLRVFRQQTLEEFAAYSRVPIINGLSDLYHPCQALGDLFTMQEIFGSMQGRTVVFVGDGNNVARSLAVICAKLGARFILAAPTGLRLRQCAFSRATGTCSEANPGRYATPSRRCAMLMSSIPTSGPAWARKRSGNTG